MSKIKVDNTDGGGCTPAPYYKEPKPAQVDVKDSADVARWAGILAVSERELLDLVSEFGPYLRDIRRGRRSRSNQAA